MNAAAVWRALGTNVHLLVTDGDLDVARAAVEETLARVDGTYSRFRADSELTRLNAAAGETLRVSDLLARAIDAGMRAAVTTGGLVDPTVGRAVRATGYDADFPVVARRTGGTGGPTAVRPPTATAALGAHAPSPASPAAPAAFAGTPAALAGMWAARADAPVVRIERVPGWRAVRFDPRGRTVRVPRGVAIDLDSVGKALAADLSAAGAVDAMGPDAGVLVSLGGDIAVAGAPPPGGWRIAVGEDSGADPRDADEVVTLSAGAVATSSTMVRRWRRDGEDVHHIIDPRTGAPAAGPWRTATVVAATCVDANAAATAAIVAGTEAVAWLRALHLPARLVATDGTVVRIAGWPAPAATTPRPERNVA